MLISFASSLICTTSCFLYPAYASYKALSLRPELSPDASIQIERWLQYWAVVGSWTAIEAVFGWLFTWIPFYTLFKALTFFYLSLPQSGGAAYIYHAQLEPFFHEHERDIDAFIANLRTRATVFVSDSLNYVWDRIRTQIAPALAAQQQQQQHDETRQYPTGPMNAPPTLNDPASGAVQQMYGAFTHFAGQYLPVAMSALTAAAAATSRAASSTYSSSSNHLPPFPSDPSSSHTMSHAQSSSDLSHTDPIDQSIHTHTSHLQAKSASFTSGRTLSPASSNMNLRPSGIGGSNRSSEDSFSSKWGGASGYEEIRKEEVEGAVVMDGTGGRPGVQRASGSWFSWNSGSNGSPSKDKAE